MPVHSCRSLPRSFFEALSIILACISSLLPCAAQSARVDRGPVHSCSDLKSQKIGSAQIGLPTRGALIDSARLAKGAAGGYCRVLGSITSVDPFADPIRFEVNLPETWNGKAVQFGGGGFDGYLRQSDGRRLPSCCQSVNRLTAKVCLKQCSVGLRWPAGGAIPICFNN